MRVLPGLVATLILLGSAWTQSALAHGDGEPWLFVPETGAGQGEEFTLLGDDFDPGDQLIVEIFVDSQPYQLGTVEADELGHFEVSLRVPEEMPDGYAEISAMSSSGGSIASMWLRVGNTSGGAPSPPLAQAPIELDPSVWVLGVFIGGATAALLYLVLRPTGRRPAPAETGSVAKPPRTVPRKSKVRSRPRRT